MSADSPKPSAVRRYVLLALKLSVSLALMILLFSRIDVMRLWATARRASIGWLAVALALFGVNALVLVAALGATAAGILHPGAGPISPVWLWAGFLIGIAVTAPAVLAPD